MSLKPACTRYLKNRVSEFGLAAILMCWSIYLVLTGLTAYPGASYVVMLLAGAALAAIVGKPRWIVYAFLIGAFIVRLYSFVHIVANGPQDADSIRDEAVEVAARALLRGENAWTANREMHITTGPTSILLALPFVWLFGQTNWLTFIFWLLFAGILLWSDIRLRNRTFPVLVMLFMLGLFDIEHTLYWSLDELYYAILCIAAGYFFVTTAYWRAAGAMFAAAALSRPNYLLLFLGFGSWYCFDPSFRWRNALKIATGFVLGCAGILLPFVVIGGRDLWLNNPWRSSAEFIRTTWPETNVAFYLLNRISEHVGTASLPIVKLGLFLWLMFGAALGLRRRNLAHPFWHITVGALLAHIIVWLPSRLPRDYTLMFVLPAMLGIAFTPMSDRLAPGKQDSGKLDV